MNYSLLVLEYGVVGIGLALLLVDSWTPAERKRSLGYAAAAAVGLILIGSFSLNLPETQYAFKGMYVMDGLALFFKRFFLLATLLVLLMSVEFADRLESGVSEFYALILFALSGMMFAASANDFALLFVSVELIAVTFYILVSYLRRRETSLEGGVKYLIIGALSSAFMIYGIALVFGTTGLLNFDELARVAPDFLENKVFLMGVLMVMAGLGFKIAAFPFQIWAPDVYQGAPAPTTAFLAVGSKAAGMVLLLRVLFTAVPEVTLHWPEFLMVLSGLTILYGNLCALPQRNIKRLLGYSSIAHAGYLLLGFSALTAAGQSAVLYYLSGYLFTVLGAFVVICLVMRRVDGEDISAFAGLNQRSPLLAAAMTMAMVSLAGIPPLAGFFGKFLLLRSVVERGAETPAYYWLAAVALLGVVISIYYYFGVIRALYWSQSSDVSRIPLSPAMRGSLYACMAGMFFIGVLPGPLLRHTDEAVTSLQRENAIRLVSVDSAPDPDAVATVQRAK